MKLIMENWRTFLDEQISPEKEAKIMSQVAKDLDNFMKKDQDGRNMLARYYNQVGPGKKYKVNDDALAAYKKDNGIAPNSDRVFKDYAPKHREWVENIHKNYPWVWSKLDPQDGQGGASWHNLSILMQHADSDIELQKFYRDKILKEYHPRNGKNGKHEKPYNDRWEYISDRISCAQTGTQKYGTQGNQENEERFKKCGPGT